MSSANDELRYQALVALPLGEEGGLEELLRALRDDSWRVRKVAVERMTTEVQADRAVPKLVEALSDQDDASLRNSALEALVRYDGRAVSALCAALESGSGDLRKFALDALGEIRSPVALPSLRAALHDGDPNVRTAAVEALGKLGTAAAFDDLLEIAGSTQIDLQLAALVALGRSETVVPFGVLEPHLGNRYLRRAAVRALGRSGGPQAEKAILAAAADGSRGTREAAFAALALEQRNAASTWPASVAMLGPMERAPLSRASIEMLDSEELGAAEGAAYLLSWLGSVEVAISLVLAAEREELRAPLLQALVLLGPDILPALARGLDALPAVSRCLALDALAALATAPPLHQTRSEVPEGFLRGARDLAFRSLTDDEGEVRVSAMALLGAAGDGRSASALFGFLADEAMAEVALQALGEIGDRAKEELRGLCRSRLVEAPDSLPHLLRLLGRVGTVEDLPALRSALRGGRPAERRAAAEGLASLDLPECTNLLRTALTDEDPGVRRHAALGLSGVRTQEAVGALVAALRDPDPLVAAAAVEGLGACHMPEQARDLVEVIDRELAVRPVVALAALVALDGQGPVEASVLERSVQAADPELAKAGLRIAAKQGLWALVHGLAKHSRWDVRSEVAAALGREGGPDAEALLVRMQELEHDALAGKAVASALAAIAESRRE